VEQTGAQGGEVRRVRFRYDDGGRAAAGFRGPARDCAARAIAIASGWPYEKVYQALASEGGGAIYGSRLNHPHTGLRQSTVAGFLNRQGWRFTAARRGATTPVRLRGEELPMGRLIVALATHVCAVIDGVIYDTYDCSRGGRSRVHGFWSFE
jgi:hypothetical protein